MLNREIDSIISQSYSRLGSLALEVARNRDKGFDTSKTQRETISKALQIRKLLQIVLDHVSINEETGKVQYLLRTSDVTMNKFLRELVKLSDIQDYPVAPLLFHKAKPRVLNTGPQGPAGNDGQNGSDATVDVIPDTGEDEIEVNEQIISLIKTFKLNLKLYKAPELNVEIQGTKVFEIGALVNNLQVNVISKKGRDNVASIVSSFNNTAFQSILNLTQVNGVTQPFTTAFVVSGLTTDTDFNFTLTDASGRPEGVVVKGDSIKFYRPFIFGASDGISIDHYQLLSKLLAPKENTSVPLNGDYKYFWIGYPASYGEAIRILDKYGVNRFDDFTSVLVNVTSQNLATNWTVQYRFYRTTNKTSIDNQFYRLQFSEFDDLNNEGYELVEGPPGIGVPAGGTTGQVLKKTSNADYATAWQNEAGAGGGEANDAANVGTGGVSIVDGKTGVTLNFRSIIAGSAKVTATLDAPNKRVVIDLGTVNIADISGLVSALAGKADSVHSHAISDITGLVTALAGKADTSHTHIIANVTGLQSALDAKASINQSIINAIIFG